jgi:hypothetical protein
MKSRHLIIVALIGFFTVAIAQVLTAYRVDKQQYYNRDAAQNATDIISTLSCILNQTGADQETATSSSYAVWVDEDRCRVGSVNSSDAGVQFSKYWVQQELVDGVLKVRWWEYGDSINGERPTYASAEISKGAEEGSANPYGVWSVNWCVSHLAADLADKTGDEACHQKGHAYISETNEYGLFYKRVASGTSTAYEKLTAGAVDQDLASGLGKFKETLADGSVREGSFGFADGALKQTYNGADVCKSPVANSPDSLHQIWDGWLYNIDTQARVESATGPFAVKRVSDGAVGWASHEGVRLTGSSMPESDGKFVRVEGADKTELDAFTTAGVLIKRTPNLLVNGLQDIDNLKLRFKVKRDAFVTSLFSDVATTPASPQTDQYVVGYWNQTEGKFIFTGYDISANGLTGKYFRDYSTPFKFSVAELVQAMQSTTRTYERSLWTFLMGSNQEYYLQLADSVGNPRPALADPLVYRLDQTRVIPGSADAPTEELICIGKCPRPGTGSNGEKLVLDLDKYSWSKAAFEALPKYTFDASGNLTVSGISVDYLDIDRNGQDGFREDLWLDRFIPKSELSKLACEDDKNYCSYDTKLPTSTTSGETAGAVMGVNATYTWSTGPYRWTKFAGLKKADGTVVSIDQPLDLFYNVPDEDVYGASKGRRVALQYPGNGKLWMPGRCERLGGGEPSRDCSGATEIYVNDFIIPYDPNDSTKGVVQDVQGNRYLVKWTRKGIYYPNHSDPNACSASNVVAKFDSGDALQLPSASVWVNPRESMGSTIPADADPTKPRYVDGVKVN